MDSLVVTNEIEQKIKELKITSLDISFNELADMYDNGELIINPDYQRTFRWDVTKQSRFIESLLMEMPIPPIYVIELDSGVYELIDGLQRISSYLNYIGVLKQIEQPLNPTALSDSDEDVFDYGDEDAANININEFSLSGCDIIESLNELKYSNLNAALKIKLKRSYVRMEILRKGINPELKYHMFKRLNTGGEKLEPQELRNCTIRLIDNKFINYINALSSDANFQATIEYISIAKKQKKFAEELVLRFFSFKNDRSNFSHDVGAFMTSYMEKVSLADSKKTPIFNYEEEERCFKSTFGILNRCLGKQIFSANRNNSDNFTGFNVYFFEAITTGLQSIISNAMNDSIDIDKLREKLIEIKRIPDFRQATIGGGKNSVGVFLSRYTIVRDKLSELL